MADKGAAQDNSLYGALAGAWNYATTSISRCGGSAGDQAGLLVQASCFCSCLQAIETSGTALTRLACAWSFA